MHQSHSGRHPHASHVLAAALPCCCLSMLLTSLCLTHGSAFSLQRPLRNLLAAVRGGLQAASGTKLLRAYLPQVWRPLAPAARWPHTRQSQRCIHRRLIARYSMLSCRLMLRQWLYKRLLCLEHVVAAVHAAVAMSGMWHDSQVRRVARRERLTVQPAALQQLHRALPAHCCRSSGMTVLIWQALCALVQRCWALQQR